MGAMLMTEWVLIMDLVMVLTSVLPMGMWLVWWRSETLGMWKDIAGGNQVDEMVVKMMVVEMDWFLECTF